MLVFWEAGLVLLAVPKTGTHALEEALLSKADIAFRHPPRLKHMNFEWTQKSVLRMFGDKDRKRFRTIAAIREPIDWLGSWYRYRSRADLKGSPRSTADLSFSEFLEGYLSDPQPEYARLGRQWRFLRAPDGKVGVDFLFSYEDLPDLVEFMAESLDTKIEIKRRNVSPRAELKISDGLRQRAQLFLQKDYNLYNSVKAARSTSS